MMAVRGHSSTIVWLCAVLDDTEKGVTLRHTWLSTSSVPSRTAMLFRGRTKPMGQTHVLCQSQDMWRFDRRWRHVLHLNPSQRFTEKGAKPIGLTHTYSRR